MSLKYKVKKENPKWNIKNHKKNCDTTTRKAKATIQPISIVWYACACLMPQSRMKSRKQMKKKTIVVAVLNIQFSCETTYLWTIRIDYMIN